MNDIIIALIVFGGILAPLLIGANAPQRKDMKRVLERLEEIQVEQARQNNAITAIISDRLHAIYVSCRRTKSIGKSTLEGVCKLFDVYVKSGGNGYIKTIVQKMKNFNEYDDS